MSSHHQKNTEFEKDNLPKGWIRIEMENICDLIGGGTPSRKISEYFDGDVIWLTPTEIPKEKITKINTSKEKITQLGLAKSSAKLTPSNAVLLTSRASIGYVAISGTEVTTNQGFASFVCSKMVHNYFLAYWLWANRKLLVEKATGTTFKEIPKSVIKKLEINIPPLNEQKRIVTKVESIFAQIDAAKEKLEALSVHARSASGSLAQLRSSVLKQAFEGRLVPQDAKDEPAEVLLKRIHEGSGKELIIEKDNLPEGWIRTELKNCVEILDSRRIPINSSERKQRQGNIPYYGSTGQVGWIDDYLFDEELTLLGEDAAPFLDRLKDKAYLISGKSWVNNHAHVLKGINEILHNRFLCFFLNQFDYHEYVTGTTRLKLNQARMKMIPVLLPPLNEQHRIVTKIESIFSRIDAGSCLVMVMSNWSLSERLQWSKTADSACQYHAGVLEYPEMYACPFWFSIILTVGVFIIVSAEAWCTERMMSCRS